MSKEFEIAREVQLAGTPEQVWDALTTNIGGWLWPMEVEPRLGGAAAFGAVVTAWDPPHHFANRVDGEDGWFNQLDNVIEQRADGVWLRYVHSGVFVEDWDNQYNGAAKHTDFYLHTLDQYLRHFAGRSATFTSVDGPESSKDAAAFDLLRKSLGLSDGARVGDEITAPASTPLPSSAELDYRNEYFIGLRTGDAMYRFFGRNHFGMPVGVAVHHFGDSVDEAALTVEWQNWLNDLYR